MSKDKGRKCFVPYLTQIECLYRKKATTTGAAIKLITMKDKNRHRNNVCAMTN